MNFYYLRKIAANFRLLLRRLGLDIAYSDDELRELFRRSRNALRKANSTAMNETRFALFDNPQKRISILNALQKIANGSEEGTISNLRNDLAKYGGTNDITFYWGNEKKGIYHIAYRRGMKTLLHVIDAVADGKIDRFVEGNKTIILEKDGYEAVLALTEYGNQKSWRCRYRHHRLRLGHLFCNEGSGNQTL
jgi:hypothetical protein